MQKPTVGFELAGKWPFCGDYTSQTIDFVKCILKWSNLGKLKLI